MPSSRNVTCLKLGSNEYPLPTPVKLGLRSIDGDRDEPARTHRTAQVMQGHEGNVGTKSTIGCTSTAYKGYGTTTADDDAPAARIGAPPALPHLAILWVGKSTLRSMTIRRLSSSNTGFSFLFQRHQQVGGKHLST